jgi:taurine dioxygenase
MSCEVVAIPFDSALAAEVRGVDLARELDEEVVTRVRAALLRHLVLVFRNQKITPSQQAAFARRFGTLQRHDYFAGLPEEPAVLEIRKEPGQSEGFGASWHSDNSYLPNPPLGAVLHAIALPATGGDTLWSNQILAFEALPEPLRARVETLRAVHRADAAFGVRRRLGQHGLAPTSEVVHPLVRTHPESGHRALFHSGVCTARLEGCTLDASRALLDDLLRRATHPDLVYRHRWKPHDVVFWDNRCTLHLAMNDYPGQCRVVHRVSIEGQT